MTNTTTEEKIKQTARKLFISKGFSATTIRDIASEAGLNSALVNYYFRSKEKLFEQIMLENMRGFFAGLVSIVNDSETAFDEKVGHIVSHYSDMLLAAPDTPLFLLTEFNKNPKKILEIVNQSDLKNSVFFKHIGGSSQGVHLLFNLLGLTIFPFIARPMAEHLFGLDKSKFEAVIAERKRMIPIWISAIKQSSGGDQ